MNIAMPSSFKQEEWDYLNNSLRVTTTESLDRTYSISSLDLLDESKCAVYLDQLANMYSSPSRKTTASVFSKRYAFLLINPALYAMTVYNKEIDMSVRNCHVESGYNKDIWMPNIRFSNTSVMQPASDNRYEWRDQLVKSIFAEHLLKIWQSISKVASIPMSILWENTAIYIYWIYEKQMGNETGKQEKQRIQEDFDYLIHDAPATLFGEKINPLATFYRPKCRVAGSEESVRIRKTCCFYYQISLSNSYCSTCPLKDRSKG